MFQKALILVGLGILAAAFRGCGKGYLKKAGALLVLLLSFLLGYFVFKNWMGGLAVASIWIFLPWVELLSRTRKLRFPVNNRLAREKAPNLQFFPDAAAAAHALENHFFEPVNSSGWHWAGMHQHFITYWHPEECATATICLCEQEDVVFSFLSITTETKGGERYRTTNFPFASMLKACDNLVHNHLPCKQKDFEGVLDQHRAFLEDRGVTDKDLLMPDPENIDNLIEAEMQDQLRHNEAAGLIATHADGTFSYTGKGLLFLWRQFLKDMIRLC